MSKNKVKSYTSYKHSGEDWIGDVPDHWEVVKLKRLFREKKKTTNVNLPCGSISFGKVVYKDDEKIPESTKRSYQVLTKGEFLINPLNLNYDLISLRIGLSDIDVVVSSGYIILNSIIELDKSYYKWLLHRYDVAHMKTMGSGVRQTISFTHIADSLLVYPPLKEQTAIAEFLDKKTALIDQAISIKEKQIELLKEHKQILIQKAVTQGLNPKVKFKDSGVEWIGEIPEHWEVSKIKNVLKEKQFKSNSKLKAGAISFGNVVYKSDESILESTKRSYQELLTGEFLLNPLNLNYDLKSLRIALSNIDVVVSAGYIILNSIINLNKEYLNYLLHIFDVMYMKTLGSGVRQTLKYSDISSCLIVLPPTDEQNKIVEFINESLNKIFVAITSKEQEIEKLKEYKSTLINSAVTGKIKVC